MLNRSLQDNPQAFIDTLIRTALIVGLVIWCYQIIRPFITMVLWGVIIAVAVYPLHCRLRDRLGGRSGWSATLLTLLLMTMLVVPAVVMSDALIQSSTRLSQQLESSQFHLPPPNETVRGWPLVGDSLYTLWQEAAANLQATLQKFSPQIKAVGKVALGALASITVGILQFMFSLITAGFILARAELANLFLQRLVKRLAGEQSESLLTLMTFTIRSVAKGVLGVALIQALLAGVGFSAMDIPAASVLAMLCFLLAVVQISVGLVTLPVAVYVFSITDTLTASLFLGYMLVVGMLDNVLKPILLGRGVDVPMLVVFMGVIGGFLMSGIIGLFVGAIVLVVGYRLLLEFVGEGAVTGASAPSRNP
ncbi:AI-2E family transporter [Aestuariirhabdus litorea]|uniref:AI-2E family transporter n=1 Tax=Aestuariirhabdus litorea TaxID=2528527 RepID=A0A3P3VNV3_9GAMM|nr:AI-2E family transporter [Aestuariirhabdus litorea]RRJ83326.1 AI-2E family transporter [Aestuariirhabdus litorea]RWW93486.1 AI-2E family transporter [Endozoicomonadaceae bacterium GTF-13]